MYSYKSQYPIRSLPNRIRLSNGFTKTDPTTFTPEDILDAGYVEVPEPPTPSLFQKVSWLNGNWVLEDLSEGEKQNAIRMQWEVVRSERNRLLQDTDWVVIKHVENGSELLESFLTYRQSLRDITKQPDPYNIVWPALTASEGVDKV